jgi:hypothetical protein
MVIWKMKTSGTTAATAVKLAYCITIVIQNAADAAAP